METNSLTDSGELILKEAGVPESLINPKFLGPTAEELARLSLARWLEFVPIDTRERPDRLARLLNQGSSQE